MWVMHVIPRKIEMPLQTLEDHPSKHISKGLIGFSQGLVAAMEHGSVDTIRGNATSNPRCASCLVANNSYYASKQSP
jgi:hypothetical protein